MIKRVFYFNINYNCNNRCVFCYSHNTVHGNSSEGILTFQKFKEYVNKYKIKKSDRIILNGGEPTIHKEINEFLKYVYLNDIETLIYTNGRNIGKLSPKYIGNNVRFVVPVHGNSIIHDKITGIPGSYKETINSLKWLKENCKKALVDMKIILNSETIKEEGFTSSFEDWKTIDFNNSIHITMMADTLISRSNGCKTLDREKVSYYTDKLCEAFKDLYKLKIYDTCVNSLEILKDKKVERYDNSIDLYYKDNFLDKKIILKKGTSCCSKECSVKEFCTSEILEHKVLEVYKDKVYENME